MKILFLSRWFPYPFDNGSKLRIYNLLRQLANQHTVDLISFTSEEISKKRLVPLQPFCRYIETVQYRPFEPLHLKAMIGFFSPLPRSVLDTDNTNMHIAIQRKMQETQYDLVIASEVDMAQYARNLPLVKILEDVELATLHDMVKARLNPFKKRRNMLMWQKWARYIVDTMYHFDGGTVVSEPERQLLEFLLQKSGCITPIQIIPNGVDISYYREDHGKPMPDTLVFSGALTYSANYNAMDYFLNEIFPLIQLKTPNVKLTITGCLNGVPVENLSPHSGVVFTDYLDDIRPTIARSWVSIVPLKIGGGTRLKILEALALGTPVVSTSKGAEGLELTPNQDILIADNPSDFASAVLRLFADPILRQTIGQNGQHAVATRYDWKMIGQSLGKFINQLSK
jgi:glycosyltransferase involved in cell wall biosynthesis